jgi:hypothetical protein
MTMQYTAISGWLSEQILKLLFVEISMLALITQWLLAH